MKRLPSRLNTSDFIIEGTADTLNNVTYEINRFAVEGMPGAQIESYIIPQTGVDGKTLTTTSIDIETEEGTTSHTAYKNKGRSDQHVTEHLYTPKVAGGSFENDSGSTIINGVAQRIEYWPGEYWPGRYSPPDADARRFHAATLPSNAPVVTIKNNVAPPSGP